MKALVLHSFTSPPVIEERPLPEPGPGQIRMRIHAASLNRRDYWITQNLYPGIQLPVVLGSDAAGIVEAIGPEGDASLVGLGGVIQPGMNWGEDPRAQGPRFEILGTPKDGLFATHAVVPADRVYPKPAHLGFAEAATLPVAGVTAWRALFFQGDLKPGQRVLVTGAGGGVAVFALQFALAAGASVWVTSGDPEKIQRARALGAVGGVNYKEDGWSGQLADLAGLFDLIVDGAGGPGYAELVRLAAPGGRIINYGATAGKPSELDLFKVFWKQIRIQGSTLGSPADFAAMLAFVETHRIVPVIDQTLPLERGAEAIEAMGRSSQFGKHVLTP